MRWVSTEESVERGEVSILALAETFFAMCLVFYLSTHFNTVRWLAIAICITPFLLVRTETSVEFGRGLLLAFINKRTRFPMKVFDEMFMIPSIYFWHFFILTLATLYSTIICPADALRAIPKNWSRGILSVHFGQPFYFRSSFPKVGFRARLRQWTRSSFVWRVGLICLLPTDLLRQFYRFSLKATSIVYAPLVFVVHSTFTEGTDLKTKLQLIKRSDLSRVRVAYGIVAVLMFIAKLAFWNEVGGWIREFQGLKPVQFLALYIAPSEIPIWQIAEILNSVLAIGTLIFAREALLRYELESPFPEYRVKRVLGFVSGLRWVLALYSIVCVGYITMQAGFDWHGPKLGNKLLPWW